MAKRVVIIGAGPGGLAGPLLAAATPRPLPGQFDPRPALGATALALTLLAYLTAPLRRRHRRVGTNLQRARPISP